MHGDDVRKKVLLDIFAAPSTILPVAIGGSVTLISWAVEAPAIFTFGGIAGVLAGGGIMLTRLIFGIEGLVEGAAKHLQDQKKEAFEQELDELDDLLASNRDSRDQNALRQIRLMYKNYKQQVAEGHIPSDYELKEKLDKLFRACVNQLRHSFELWKSAKSLVGDAKSKVLKERDVIVEEVVKSVEYFGRSIEEFHILNAKQSSNNLAKLREELGETLKDTKETHERIQQRLANLDDPVRIHIEDDC